MVKKISVIIPNFNGKSLLAQNLPKVIKNCPNCEIIVVDDASSDDSVKYVTKNFPKVKIIINERNLGFAKTANRGVEESRGELVALINSDVAPGKNSITSVSSYFDDKEVFAVGLCDLSHEKNRIVKRGRGGAKFKRGFVSHFAIPIKKGKTFWVSGGSGVFDRQKFLELGGFDPIFAPFYWEDIDLTFRAWKKGYKCIFEADAQVDHFHEKGAIKKSSSPFFIKVVAYRNQFLFVWKNIDNYFLIIQHILWLPYHIIRTAFSLDFAFHLGFIWAIARSWRFLVDYQMDEKLPGISANEILEKFNEKQ